GDGDQRLEVGVGKVESGASRTDRQDSSEHGFASDLDQEPRVQLLKNQPLPFALLVVYPLDVAGGSLPQVKLAGVDAQRLAEFVRAGDYKGVFGQGQGRSRRLRLPAIRGRGAGRELGGGRAAQQKIARGLIPDQDGDVVGLQCARDGVDAEGIDI